MDNGKLDLLDRIDKIASTLQRIDSCLRNGQFVLASRELGTLSADLNSMGVDRMAEMDRYFSVQDILHHLKRTGGFLQDIILAYGENNRTLDLVRRGRKAFLLDDAGKDANAG